MEKINTSRAPAAVGPYSQAIVTDGRVYTSGQIPLVPETGEIVPGGIEAQTRQVLENLKAVLQAAGSDFKHVLKTTIYIKDMSDFNAINQIYSQYFAPPYPARSCVEVAKLPKGASVEIEAIACIP